MTNEERALRNLYIATIKKAVKSSGGRAANWPGAPLGHFSVIGEEKRVLQAMIEDGTVRKVERPRLTNPDRMAVFICLP